MSPGKIWWRDQVIKTWCWIWEMFFNFWHSSPRKQAHLMATCFSLLQRLISDKHVLLTFYVSEEHLSDSAVYWLRITIDQGFLCISFINNGFGIPIIKLGFVNKLCYLITARLEHFFRCNNWSTDIFLDNFHCFANIFQSYFDLKNNLDFKSGLPLYCSTETWLQQ